MTVSSSEPDRRAVVHGLLAVTGLTALNEGVTPRTVVVRAERADGSVVSFDATVRIDTPGEADYFRNGGILQYVLRQLAARG